ncbi:hydantoinase/oxoprolinase family protein [Bacillus sp. FJAT-29937]|uniref:hydantoinase/oxoprolinase family protein n=1 Tax=Bacillus sp. FJAT-29937 TaxID=1720553 RepID=UPI0008323C32|nr:hydantoinase/oxoprolinase family protein [Bacillus sp. FJAT-29937]
MTNSTKYRVGVDIGGTFTDFVILDQDSGQITIEKTPTTPRNLWEGIRNGFDQANVDLTETAMIVHGTTVGLNCFLEKKGVRTGIITTKGFRDVYEIGRVNRIEMYDLFYKKPEPLVQREYRVEVEERLDSNGNVISALNREDVLKAAEYFRKEEIKAIAVCLLHAYNNPVHEILVGQILSEVYPEAQVSLSHQLAREWREYERTSTTVINAYIADKVGSYLSNIESGLMERGYKRPFFVNQSSGGIMSVNSAKAKPVHTIMSGPAAGAISSAYIGKLAGFNNIISFDMGGTSTDVSLTYHGKTRVTNESQIERHPLMVPMIDIYSIGAGGGSIAHIDRAGSLNVGPQSSGAEPGPACYGRGGLEPTVTDANLTLGRIPSHLLGGKMEMNKESSINAIHRISDPLTLDVVTGAAGILRIVNNNMAYAIRAVTVQRGLDPKDFVLFAFGGAGPIHACEVAEELGIKTVIVPLAPGTFSALGMLLSEIRHDFARTRLVRTELSDPLELEGIYSEMEQESISILEKEVNPDTPVRFERAVEMRYVGQEYTVRVPLPNDALTKDRMISLREDFNRLHNQAYGHSSESEPTEIINLRLAAFGSLGEVKIKKITNGGPEPLNNALMGTTKIFLNSTEGYVDCPVYNRDNLLAENKILGPALVLEKGSTTLITSDFEGVIDQIGNLLLTRKED